MVRYVFWGSLICVLFTTTNEGGLGGGCVYGIYKDRDANAPLSPIHFSRVYLVHFLRRRSR